LEELQENISSELLRYVVGFKEYIYIYTHAPAVEEENFSRRLFYVRGYEIN
jgi:hypothetical protein